MDWHISSTTSILLKHAHREAKKATPNTKLYRCRQHLCQPHCDTTHLNSQIRSIIRSQYARSLDITMSFITCSTVSLFCLHFHSEREWPPHIINIRLRMRSFNHFIANVSYVLFCRANRQLQITIKGVRARRDTLAQETDRCFLIWHKLGT